MTYFLPQNTGWNKQTNKKTHPRESPIVLASISVQGDLGHTYSKWKYNIFSMTCVSGILSLMSCEVLITYTYHTGPFFHQHYEQHILAIVFLGHPVAAFLYPVTELRLNSTQHQC